MDEKYWLDRKINLLNDTWQELRTAYRALMLSTDKALPKQEGERTFSDFNTIERLISAGTVLNAGRMAVAAYVVPRNLESLKDILHPDYQFSKDFNQLNAEIVLLLGFLTLSSVSAPEKIPDLPDVKGSNIDYAIMKALLNAGEMIEQVRHEGKKRGDFPYEGRKPWKKKGGPQEVVDSYHRMELKEVKGKEAICRAIREELISSKEREKSCELTENEKKKFIYSTKQIRRILTADESIKDFP